MCKGESSIRIYKPGVSFRVTRKDSCVQPAANPSVRQMAVIRGIPTWNSPPRSGPSLHPHNHSCHHLTSRSGSVRSGCSVGGGVAFIGAMRAPVAPGGGGVRGCGSPSGRGGGIRVDVRVRKAGWDERVLESDARGSGRSEVVIASAWSAESSNGDSGGATNAGSRSDGCMNGFSDARGLWSAELSGSASVESRELRARWPPSPPVDVLPVCRFDRSTLALRVTAPSKEGPLACADSRAALRRSRSAISHLRRFCKNGRVQYLSTDGKGRSKERAHLFDPSRLGCLVGCGGI